MNAHQGLDPHKGELCFAVLQPEGFWARNERVLYHGFSWLVGRESGIIHGIEADASSNIAAVAQNLDWFKERKG